MKRIELDWRSILSALTLGAALFAAQLALTAERPLAQWMKPGVVQPSEVNADGGTLIVPTDVEIDGTALSDPGGAALIGYDGAYPTVKAALDAQATSTSLYVTWLE